MNDKQIIRIAKDFRMGLLGSHQPVDMCMAVSAPLQGLLSVYGLETTIETVEFPQTNHVFLRLPDGRILDATADQFGLDPIYLGEMPEVYRHWIEEPPE